MFKAAIPTAAITNIISYNYMTYYNQYEADGVGRVSASGQSHGRPVGALRAEARRERRTRRP